MSFLLTLKLLLHYWNGWSFINDFEHVSPKCTTPDTKLSNIELQRKYRINKTQPQIVSHYLHNLNISVKAAIILWSMMQENANLFTFVH